MRGLKANNNGKGLELQVETSFRNKCFNVVDYREWYLNPYSYGSNLLIHNYPYVDITGAHCKMEYFVLSESYDLKARLECKWQSVKGTADEKLCKLYLDCIEEAHPANTIIVVDGGAQRRNYIEWLKRAAKSRLYTNEINADKVIKVMNLIELIKWVNDMPITFGNVLMQKTSSQTSLFD